MPSKYCLENTNTDKYTQHLSQLRKWIRETEKEQQLVFITSDHKKVVCNIKIMCLFSDLIRKIIKDLRKENNLGATFLTIPTVSSQVMKSLYNIITKGFSVISGSILEELTQAAQLFGINIPNLNAEAVIDPPPDPIDTGEVVKSENDDIDVSYNDLFAISTEEKHMEQTQNPPEYQNIVERNDNYIFETDQAYPCPQCDVVYDSKLDLNKHIGTEHKTADGKYPCSECDNVYASRDRLNRHLIQHTVPDGKPFECVLCDTTFSRRDALTRHMKRKH